MNKVIRYSARQLTSAGKPGDFQVVEASEYDALLVHNETLQEECDRLAIRPDKMASEITKLTEKLTYRDNQLGKARKLLREMAIFSWSLPEQLEKEVISFLQQTEPKENEVD